MSLFSRGRQAFLLILRYGQVFREQWGIRKSYKADFYNRQEAEFLPSALALQNHPDASGLRRTAYLLTAIVVVVLAWATWGRIDIVVSATGRVIPSGRTKTIASVDLASVRALHVVEGQRVSAGDLLVELDSSGSDAEQEKAADRVLQAQLQMARAEGLIALVRTIDHGRPATSAKLSAVPGATPAQWQAAQGHLAWQSQDFIARINRLDATVARHLAALPLVRQRARDMQVLLATHDVSLHAWMEPEYARIDLEGQLMDAQGQRSVLLAQTIREAHDALNDGRRVVASSRPDERRAAQRSQLLRLVSPVDGTVQQLTTHTVGGVVPAAQALMQIVPKDSAIEVEAMLDNRDVGFVHEGQAVAVKIDAYDYTKYGNLHGTVRHVSHDAVQDERRGLLYPVRIALTQSTIAIDGKRLPITAGMAVNLDIKTGTRRVIEFVISPLIRHQKEALRER
jgi:hemolysin D